MLSSFLWVVYKSKKEWDEHMCTCDESYQHCNESEGRLWEIPIIELGGSQLLGTHHNHQFSLIFNALQCNNVFFSSSFDRVNIVQH